MILHVAMIQELGGWRIACDCGLWVYRDGEGNFECHEEDCGLSW